MTPVFALQPLEKSLFLAGPTPRDPQTPSWRPSALEILKNLNFPGKVYIPESPNWSPHHDYDNQIFWEWEALNIATVCVFWVPREIQTMPAFTTNVEYGLLCATGKAVLGFPKNAPKTRYLEQLALRFKIPVFHDLSALLRFSAQKAMNPFGAAPSSF